MIEGYEARQNFQAPVGTSDLGSELLTSSNSHDREGFIGNYLGTPKRGSELPTLGRNFRPSEKLQAEDPLSGDW